MLPRLHRRISRTPMGFRYNMDIHRQSHPQSLDRPHSRRHYRRQVTRKRLSAENLQIIIP